MFIENPYLTKLYTLQIALMLFDVWQMAYHADNKADGKPMDGDEMHKTC